MRDSDPQEKLLKKQREEKAKQPKVVPYITPTVSYAHVPGYKYQSLATYLEESTPEIQKVLREYTLLMAR